MRRRNQQTGGIETSVNSDGGSVDDNEEGEEGRNPLETMLSASR